MKPYMLDTDMCSYILRERPINVLKHFKKLQMEQICISIVSYAELLYGVERSQSKKINRPIVDDFVRHLSVMSWETEAAEHYAIVRTKLEMNGTPIGAMDMMIAAHAKSLNAVLVSNNQKHFRRVKGLKLENWI